MIEKIKSELFKKYKNDDIKGLFISLFDDKNNLLLSNGVIKTDKSLDKLIDTLYYGLMDKVIGVKLIVLDIVEFLQKESDLKKLLDYSVKEYGFGLISIDGQTNGIILPNMKGVNDVKSALNSIKQKNGISGNVEIYIFKTNRLEIKN